MKTLLAFLFILSSTLSALGSIDYCDHVDAEMAEKTDKQIRKMIGDERVESPYLLSFLISRIDSWSYRNYLMYSMISALDNSCGYEGVDFDQVFGMVDFDLNAGNGETALSKLKSYPMIRDLALLLMERQVKNDLSLNLPKSYSKWNTYNLRIGILERQANSVGSHLRQLVNGDSGPVQHFSYPIDESFSKYDQNRMEFFEHLRKLLLKKNQLAIERSQAFDLVFEYEKIKTKFLKKDPFFKDLNFKSILSALVNDADLTISQKINASIRMLEEYHLPRLQSRREGVNGVTVILNFLDQVKNEELSLDRAIETDSKEIKELVITVKTETENAMDKEFVKVLALAKSLYSQFQAIDQTSAPKNDPRYIELVNKLNTYFKHISTYDEKVVSLSAKVKRYKELRGQINSMAFKRLSLQLGLVAHAGTILHDLDIYSKFQTHFRNFLHALDSTALGKSYTQTLANKITKSNKDSTALIVEYLQLAQHVIKTGQDYDLDEFSRKLLLVKVETDKFLTLRKPSGCCRVKLRVRIKIDFGGGSGGVGFDAFKIFESIMQTLDKGVASLGTGINDALKAVDEKLVDKLENEASKGVDKLKKVKLSDFVLDPKDIIREAGKLKELTENVIVSSPINELVKGTLALARPDIFLENLVKSAEVVGNQVGKVIHDGTKTIGKTIHDGGKLIGDGMHNVIREVYRGGLNIYNVTADAVEDAQKLSDKAIVEIYKVAKKATLIEELENRIPALKKWTNRFETILRASNSTYFHMMNGRKFYKVDGYREAYNVYHQEALSSLKELKSIPDKAVQEAANKLLAKVDQDLADAVNKVIELQSKGVDVAAAVASFDNVARISLVAAGTILSGGSPVGGALGNMIADRFIVDQNISEKELLQNFAISLAGGLAAQQLASTGPIYEQIARNMTDQAAKAGLKNEAITDKALITGILTGIVAGGQTDINIPAAARDSLVGASNYVIENAVHKRPIIIDEAIYSGIRTAANAQLSNEINKALQRPVTELKEDLEAAAEKSMNLMAEKLIRMKEALAHMMGMRTELMELQALIDQELNTNREPQAIMAILAAGAAAMTLVDLHEFYIDKMMDNQEYIEFLDHVKRNGLDSAVKSGKFENLLNDKQLQRDIVTKVGTEILINLAAAGGIKLIKKIGTSGVAQVVKSLTKEFGQLSKELLSSYVEKISRLGINTADEMVDFINATKNHLGKRTADSLDNALEMAVQAGKKTKDEVIAFFQKSKEILGSEIGSIGNLDSTIHKAAILKGSRKELDLIIKDIDGGVFEISKEARDYLEHQVKYADKILKDTGLKKFDADMLKEMANKYDELAFKMKDIKGTGENVLGWRSVEKSKFGTAPFDHHIGNVMANHRFTHPGSGATYATVTNSADEAVRLTRAELKVTDNVIVSTDSQMFELKNCLDLTDSKVRDKLGITLDDINMAKATKSGIVMVNEYQVTHQIGALARDLGFDGIKAPSAVGDGINVIVFKDLL